MRYLFVICLLLIVNIASAQDDYAVITPENAHQLERVARLGRGYVGNIWFEDNTTLMVSNVWYPDESWQYDTRDMAAAPIFHPSEVLASIELSNLEPSYSYYNNDGRWIVTREGIWNTESAERIVALSDDRTIHTWLTTERYLIVWRTLLNSSELTCLQDDSACIHHILIIDTETERVHHEFYQDDIVAIQSTLNGSHLAITREQSTDFYILSRRAVTLAFWLDIPVTYFSKNGNYAIEHQNLSYQLQVWNLQTGSIQMRLQYLEGERITGFHLSDNGRWLAVETTLDFAEPNTPNFDYPMKNIGIWDTQTGARLSLIEYFAPRSAMMFSEDGHYFGIFTQTEIFYNSPDDSVFFIILYETETGRQIAQIDNNLWRSASDMAFSPDNRYFAISFWDGRIVLLDIATGETLVDNEGYPGYVEFVHFDEEHIITSSSNGQTDWWDLDSFNHVQRDDDCPLVGLNVLANRGVCHRYYLSGHELISSSLTDLSPLERIPFQNEELADTFYLTATFSPDGRHMITTYGSGSVPIVWDTETQEQIATLEGADTIDGVREVQYLADGTIIASRSNGILWDATTFEIIAQVPSEVFLNSLGTYSETGDWAAFPVIDNYRENLLPTGSLVIWRLSDLYSNPAPEPIAVLDGYPYGVVAASPDGKGNRTKMIKQR